MSSINKKARNRYYVLWAALAVMAALIIFGVACGSKDKGSGPSKKSSEAKMLSFSFDELTPPVVGVIDTVNKEVAVTLPAGTAVTGLVPTITVSPKATVSPLSGTPQDFTVSPVVYVVTAENMTDTAAYMVTVTVPCVTGVDCPTDPVNCTVGEVCSPSTRAQCAAAAGTITATCGTGPETCTAGTDCPTDSVFCNIGNVCTETTRSACSAVSGTTSASCAAGTETCTEGTNCPTDAVTCNIAGVCSNKTRAECTAAAGTTGCTVTTCTAGTDCPTDPVFCNIGNVCTETTRSACSAVSGTTSASCAAGTETCTEGTDCPTDAVTCNIGGVCSNKTRAECTAAVGTTGCVITTPCTAGTDCPTDLVTCQQGQTCGQKTRAECVAPATIITTACPVATVDTLTKAKLASADYGWTIGKEGLATAYFINTWIEVPEGEVLTILPGTTISFAGAGSGIGMAYAGNAVINAVGTPLLADGVTSGRIVLKGSTAIMKWRGIEFRNATHALNKLSHVDFINAGRAASDYAALYLNNSVVDIDNCVIDGSDGHGIRLYDASEFRTFTKNTVKNSGKAPISLWTTTQVYSIRNMANDNTFTGNVEEYIDVRQSYNYTIPGDMTLPSLNGYPYLFDGITVSGTVKFTVEKGTVILMTVGRNIRVGESAHFIAVGTATDSITIKGFENVAGYWCGIEVKSQTSGTKFDYVNISDGGRDGCGDALIEYYAGAYLEIYNSHLSNSQFHGIRVGFANASQPSWNSYLKHKNVTITGLGVGENVEGYAFYVWNNAHPYGHSTLPEMPDNCPWWQYVGNCPAALCDASIQYCTGNPNAVNIGKYCMVGGTCTQIAEGAAHCVGEVFENATCQTTPQCTPGTDCPTDQVTCSIGGVCSNKTRAECTAAAGTTGCTITTCTPGTDCPNDLVYCFAGGANAACPTTTVARSACTSPSVAYASTAACVTAGGCDATAKYCAGDTDIGKYCSIEGGACTQITAGSAKCVSGSVVAACPVACNPETHYCEAGLDDIGQYCRVGGACVSASPIAVGDPICAGDVYPTATECAAGCFTGHDCPTDQVYCLVSGTCSQTAVARSTCDNGAETFADAAACQAANDPCAGTTGTSAEAWVSGTRALYLAPGGKLYRLEKTACAWSASLYGTGWTADSLIRVSQSTIGGEIGGYSNVKYTVSGTTMTTNMSGFASLTKTEVLISDFTESYLPFTYFIACTPGTDCPPDVMSCFGSYLKTCTANRTARGCSQVGETLVETCPDATTLAQCNTWSGTSCTDCKSGYKLESGACVVDPCVGLLAAIDEDDREIEAWVKDNGSSPATGFYFSGMEWIDQFTGQPSVTYPYKIYYLNGLSECGITTASGIGGHDPATKKIEVMQPGSVFQGTYTIGTDAGGDEYINFTVKQGDIPAGTYYKRTVAVSSHQN